MSTDESVAAVAGGGAVPQADSGVTVMPSCIAFTAS
jgi:hypothetical protein